MSTPAPIPARTVTLSLAAALFLSACGSTPRAQSNRSVAQDPPPATQTAATSEPIDTDASTRSAPQPEPEEAAADPAPPIEAPEVADAAPADSEPAAPTRVKPAELGRPDWWFDGVQRTERVLRLCAEAAGPTVREARRAAIDAARRRLALEVDLDPTSETVSLATVLPLPAANAGPDSAKYIGYVLMEVPAP